MAIRAPDGANNDKDDADVADEIPLTMMMLTNFMKIMRTIQE